MTGEISRGPDISSLIYMWITCLLALSARSNTEGIILSRCPTYPGTAI